MNACLDLLRGPRRVEAFDPLVEQLRSAHLAWTEEEALAPVWEQGEEARLHEDVRFERTPWGRWKLRDHGLANDLIRRALLAGWDGSDLIDRLQQWETQHQRKYLVDPDDPRLHHVEHSGNWALSDLPLKLLDQPHAEIPCVEVLSLAAAAGRFGAGEAASSRGFVLLREAVPEGAFLVQARGRSMEPAVPHGSYLLVMPGVVDQGLALAYHHGFADEIGSCVVKRVRSTGQGLELVSDNPAYRDRPLLPPDASWEEVRLIGSVRVLSPRDFLEFDLPSKRATSRDIPVEVSLERLEDKRQAALAPRPTDKPAEERQRALPAGVLALSADASCLRLALPAIVSGQGMIDVAGTRTLASNLRHPASYRVQPQTTPYRVREMEGEMELAVVPGLEGEAVTVFRAPLNGPGLRRETRAVRAGRIYRVVLPPCLEPERQELERHSWVTRLGRLQDWTCLEVELPAALEPSEQELVARIGLTFEAVGLTLEVADPVPLAYRRLESGQEVLVFASEQAIHLRLEGEPVASVQLLAVGEDTQAELSLTLDETGAGAVLLEDPPAGLLFLQARSRGTGSSLLPLWVESVSAVDPRLCQVRFLLDGQELASGQILDLEEETERLVLLTPPLWRALIRWGESADRRSRLRSDEEGRLELWPLAGTLAKAWSEEWLGVLSISCPGLWRGHLLHQRMPAPATVAGKILELAAEHDDLELLELWPLEQLVLAWVLPLARLLGYRPEWSPDRPEEVALDTPCLKGDPPALVLERESLLHLQPGLDEAQLVAESTKLRAIMMARGCREGILTNGRLWVRVDRSLFRADQRLDLPDSLQRPEALADFVRAFGA